VHEHVPTAEIVAIVDANDEQAVSLSAYVGEPRTFSELDEAIDATAPDAVVIATPTFTHKDLALTAMKRSLHVFCEKPLALSVEECDEIIDAVEASDLVLQVGFVRRFQPEFVEAKARIDAGEIGMPMLIKSLTRGPGLPPAWAQDVKLSNGMLAEVNSHDFDCVRWLVGSDIERVYTEVINCKGTRLGVTASDFYDNAVVTVRFASDVIGTIDGTCPAEYGYDARVEVVGTEGLLMIGETQGTALFTCVDRNRGGYRPVHKTWPERFAWAYIGEIRAFVESVSEELPAKVTGLDGKRAVEAVVAANRSWLEGRPVELAGETV
jgi:myo-inositol 2-dehydrogenase/D-chiro-inositol 1-dehydrogenase/scyllo-inositol 2-dehydrogenase (NAD+)